MSEPGGPLPPGSIIGIMGGGQLGRMLSIAAAQLGYRCHIYAPEADPCAAHAAARHVRGEYADEAAVRAFAGTVDVVTYEFENVPAGPLRAIGEAAPVHPAIDALELAQDRLNEKDYVVGQGGRPTDYRAVASIDELRAAIEAIGLPAILKTRRFGYDGKGQERIAAPGDAEAAWKAIGKRPAVLEAFVEFEKEFSIILVRGREGETRIWPAPDNRHADGILVRSIAPGEGIIGDQASAAGDLVRKTAEALGYVGVLTFEFFATKTGPVFNEMAPRVHNSGHWSIEGAVTSQFENHIRAVCGLPLGPTDLTAQRIEMANLIGEEAENWPAILAEPGAHLHLYGKGKVRPGRKMGHVTRLAGGHPRPS
ncbi:MAG: 5-(carboxyamino)imidazole ribonucleotide synthase [Parasphingopyxis sp.]